MPQVLLPPSPLRVGQLPSPLLLQPLKNRNYGIHGVQRHYNTFRQASRETPQRSGRFQLVSMGRVAVRRPGPGVASGPGTQLCLVFVYSGSAWVMTVTSSADTVSPTAQSILGLRNPYHSRPAKVAVVTISWSALLSNLTLPILHLHYLQKHALKRPEKDLKFLPTSFPAQRLAHHTSPAIDIVGNL